MSLGSTVSTSEVSDDVSLRYLLCLDFDLTLTQTHLFQYTASMIREGFKREEALLRSIQLIERQGPRGSEELWRVLAEWLKQGHGLVVTSFTAFPELPIALLARGVSSLRSAGATREHTRWLSRPLIIYGDPAPELNPPFSIPLTTLISPHPKDKNLHIKKALELLNHRGESFSHAVLMDDDVSNIECAQEAGYLTVTVNRDDLNDMGHLSYLLDLIE